MADEVSFRADKIEAQVEETVKKEERCEQQQPATPSNLQIHQESQSIMQYLQTQEREEAERRQLLEQTPALPSLLQIYQQNQELLASQKHERDKAEKRQLLNQQPALPSALQISQQLQRILEHLRIQGEGEPQQERVHMRNTGADFFSYAEILLFIFTIVFGVLLV